MHPKPTILGIDIGSVAISIVQTDLNKEIVNTAYLFHGGEIPENLVKLIGGFDLTGGVHLAVTSSTPGNVKNHRRYDNQVAVIAATRHLHAGARSILMVGGEKFGLIRFDKEGNYLSFKTNTSCAAGTGSFLDQQAGRLNLSGIEELSAVAFENRGDFPKIATRCAVFAKTDLIHAQQEGYSLGEISDGLCHGLARNIVDTLFGQEAAEGPMIFCGGVSKNRAVKEHIASLIGMEPLQHDLSHLYGALGAAACLASEAPETLPEPILLARPEEIVAVGKKAKKFYYEPLSLKMSEYPDFRSKEKYEYPVTGTKAQSFVEVDIYEEMESCEAFLGIDIGSTSTKAVLMKEDGTVLAGFYTRTAGRPVDAIRALFEAMDDVKTRKGLDLTVRGSASTGSGRKFVGKIVGSDVIIDEITAHARAAWEINPEVDTIIEIGGQDAKFTTLKRGTVTSSTMNTVCAAGTGSFIEEQAKKLGCPIDTYSARTENLRAPMSSDRCTVFMERDINHYLSEGFTVDEVLASVLHAVRENYLIKVATEGNIGDTVLFQGATAKNRALVAAFEQRLEKPIIVSKFCHLTGALGAALILVDERLRTTGFRGLDLHKREIPITSEVCDLCKNHCKITVAHIAGEKVAYGFLCGRDYDTKRFVNNRGNTFNLIKARNKVAAEEKKAAKCSREKLKPYTVGIPAALYLHEDLPLWRHFFELLAVDVVTSENYKTPVKEGKNLTGAEFCAPISAMHGHVNHLLAKADYVFLPHYFENRTEGSEGRRQFCYYSQFIPALVSTIGEEAREKLLMPTVRHLYTNFHTKMQLYRMLAQIDPDGVSFFEVSSAYDMAMEFKKRTDEKMRELFDRESAFPDDVQVVLVGRPYTVLSPSINSGIPDIFASLGIKAFYQDMLEVTKEERAPIEPLLQELHWNYASRILAAAEAVAKRENLYPVLITSFKCSPDAFIQDYFKQIMDAHDKPYLVLELDEHDSSVGYETRVEAAIRSFRNHRGGRERTREKPNYAPILPSIAKELTGKTIVMPNWDHLTCTLLTATLRREGFDAILMEETDHTIQKSLKFNTGQCIPLNAIAQGYIDCIEKHELDPEKTVLWLSKAEISCNIKLYPHHIRTLLHAHGNGLEKAGVYVGEISFREISIRATINAYFSFMLGGLLRRVGCKIRPYEVVKGETNRVIGKSLKILSDAFAGKRPREKAVAEIISHFEWIDVKAEARPKVAIFGDMYSRDNDVLNQGLVNFIETHGGEVITTPYSHYAKMIAGTYFKKWFTEGKYFNILSYKALLATVGRLEKSYYRYFERILNEPAGEYNEDPEKILAEYNISIDNTGESMDNILKIYYIKKHHPDISLFALASPAFCCASLITEAMIREIEKSTGIPVVAITYDGTGGSKNDALIPYLTFPRKKEKTPDSDLLTG